MKKSILLFFFLLGFTVAYGIKPVREYWHTPKDFGLNYEECRIKTADGYTLNSWHIIPQANAKKCSIIISYGDSGNMSPGLSLAAGLVKNGFDVWLYDYRGFGQSDDFEMNLDQLYYTEFVTDLSAVMGKAKATNPKNKICLFGLSMGTIINTLYYHEQPDNVNFYIGEGLVYSPEALVGRIKTNSGKEIPLPHSTVHVEQIYAGIKIPFLLFFASDDSVCNNDDLAVLKQKVEKIEIIHYEGGHLEAWPALGAQRYVQSITDFLNNNR